MTKTTTLLALSLTLVAPAAFAQQKDAETKAPKKTEAKKDLPKKQAKPVKRETLEQRIARLVGQLGHAKYEVREDAFTKLLAIGRPALPALRRAAQNPDP